VGQRGFSLRKRRETRIGQLSAFLGVPAAAASSDLWALCLLQVRQQRLRRHRQTPGGSSSGTAAAESGLDAARQQPSMDEDDHTTAAIVGSIRTRYNVAVLLQWGT
jgi:hypothetical protein